MRLPTSSVKRLCVESPRRCAVPCLLLLTHWAPGDQACYSGYDCIDTVAEAIARTNGDAFTTSAAAVDVNSTNTSGIPAALELARASEVIVLVLGIDHTIEHEGIDRLDTRLPGQQELLAAKVLALGKPVVLVLCNGGALAIDDLIDGPLAIVEAFNLNVVGSKALALSLFGEHNRWGKLPITMYPHNYIQRQPMTNYDMAKPPGRTYKYYTGTPLFSFGFGLSYTNFSLACKIVKGANYTYTCTVTNEGTLAGDEVVMVYHSAGPDVRSRAPHPVPIQSLVGFERYASATAEAVGRPCRVQCIGRARAALKRSPPSVHPCMPGFRSHHRHRAA